MYAHEDIVHRVVIGAEPPVVWAALTGPNAMKQWLGDSKMQLEVAADWVVGGRVTLTGVLYARFEATGTVLRFEPPQLLAYSQLSSLSRLPDAPENHSILQFELTPVEAGTSLTVIVTGFPTETIFKHLDFYWRGTVGILKKLIEAQ